VHINPEQVVCILEDSDRRTQIVTTGLSGEASISLIVELDLAAVSEQLTGRDLAAAHAARPLMSQPPPTSPPSWS